MPDAFFFLFFFSHHPSYVTYFPFNHLSGSCHPERLHPRMVTPDCSCPPYTPARWSCINRLGENQEVTTALTGVRLFFPFLCICIPWANARVLGYPRALCAPQHAVMRIHTCKKKKDIVGIVAVVFNPRSSSFACLEMPSHSKPTREHRADEVCRVSNLAI